MKLRYKRSYVIFLFIVIYFVTQANNYSIYKGVANPSHVQAGSGPNSTVLCQELIDGGVQKDSGIPAVDQPKYASIKEFENEFSLEYLDQVIVLGIFINGEARAYPLDILIYHEIVNDNIKGQPFSITYCPLTGSGILFNTTSIGGSSLGTTGTLFENNLIFFDRDTDTFWSQMYNVAWCGTLQGSLNMVPIIETTWHAWKALYPDTKVLTRETGYFRNYDLNPYGNLLTNDAILFPTSYQHFKLPYTLYDHKSRVLVLSEQYSFDLNTIVLPFSELSQTPLINIIQKNQPVVIVFDSQHEMAIPFSALLSNGMSLDFSSVITDFNHNINEESLGLTVFKDSSGSIWNMRGEAISGPLIGEQLTRIPAYVAFWYATTVFFPGATILINNTFVDFKTATTVIQDNTDNGELNQNIPGFNLSFSLLTLLFVVFARIQYKKK